MSFLIKVNSTDGTQAVAPAAASITDVVTSLFDPNACVTGMYKYLQLGAVFGGGMLLSNKKHTGEFMNFGSKPLNF